MWGRMQIEKRREGKEGREEGVKLNESMSV
jgi:hypothetical protein